MSAPSTTWRRLSAEARISAEVERRALGASLAELITRDINASRCRRRRIIRRRRGTRADRRTSR